MMNSETNHNNFADNEIQKLLEKVAHEEGFQEYIIENADGSAKGDGYIGIIASAKIAGKDAENQSKTLNLIVKSASKSDAFRAVMPVALAFEREIYVYDTVLPTFRAFEIEKGLSPCVFTPKLYKVNEVPKSEAILMENLKESGYKLYERKSTMDDDHVSLVMTHYGRFHALSFALRDQQPERFAKVAEGLKDVFSTQFKEMFFNSLMDRSTKALESLNKKSYKEVAEKYIQFICGLDSFIEEIEQSDEKFSVAQHGDCWTNNMMFKYEDDSNPTKPTQMRFLDLQLSKLGPPVLDLTYFFYVCSSKEIINNHNHYMQLYYDSLSTHLRKLGSDPNKVYPYAVLQQQWKKFGKFGLIMGMMIMPVMLSEKEELVDLKDAAEFGMNMSQAIDYKIAKEEEYNDRIEHIILHLVDNDFI